MRLVILLGAGFSALAGSPRTNELFDKVPTPRSRWSQECSEAVVEAYHIWRETNPEAPAERFLSWARGYTAAGLVSPLWKEVVKFIGLRLTEDYLADDPRHGGAIQWKHSVLKDNKERPHKEFWTLVLGALPRGSEICVVTTNYDIWVERSLRVGPRPRRLLPGFHYVKPGDFLNGGPGYPLSQYAHPVHADGRVPLLKLHGSLSWKLSGGGVTFYSDCRPALTGEAAIVPPAEEKEIPPWLRATWARAEEQLRSADALVSVGYSFPEYDSGIIELIRRGIGSRISLKVAISPPSAAASPGLRRILGNAKALALPRLPDGLADIREFLEAVA